MASEYIKHAWEPDHGPKPEPGAKDRRQCIFCGCRRYSLHKPSANPAQPIVSRRYISADGRDISNARPNCVPRPKTKKRMPMPELTPQSPTTTVETLNAEQLAELFKNEMDSRGINPADVISLIQRGYTSEIETELAAIEKRKAELIALRYRLQR